MYELFSAHMRQHLVDARRKQRAYNLRNLRIGEFQSPNEFGLRVEVEVVKSAPSCSIFRFAELLEAALAAQKEVQEGMRHWRKRGGGLRLTLAYSECLTDGMGVDGLPARAAQVYAQHANMAAQVARQPSFYSADRPQRPLSVTQAAFIGYLQEYMAVAEIYYQEKAEERRLEMLGAPEPALRSAGDAQADISQLPSAKMMYELVRRHRSGSHGLRQDSPYERALQALADSAGKKRLAITAAAVAAEPSESSGMVGAPAGAGRAFDREKRPPLIKWPGWDCVAEGCTAVGRERNFESNTQCYRCGKPRPPATVALVDASAAQQREEMLGEATVGTEDTEEEQLAALEAALAEEQGGSVGCLALQVPSVAALGMPAPFVAREGSIGEEKPLAVVSQSGNKRLLFEVTIEGSERPSVLQLWQRQEGQGDTQARSAGMAVRELLSAEKTMQAVSERTGVPLRLSAGSRFAGTATRGVQRLKAGSAELRVGAATISFGSILVDTGSDTLTITAGKADELAAALGKAKLKPWRVHGVKGEADTSLVPESWGVEFVLAPGGTGETIVTSDVQVVETNPVFDMLISAPILYALNGFIVPKEDKLWWQDTSKNWHAMQAITADAGAHACCAGLRACRIAGLALVASAAQGDMRFFDGMDEYEEGEITPTPDPPPRPEVAAEPAPQTSTTRDQLDLLLRRKELRVLSAVTTAWKHWSACSAACAEYRYVSLMKKAFNAFQVAKGVGRGRRAARAHHDAGLLRRAWTAWCKATNTGPYSNVGVPTLAPVDASVAWELNNAAGKTDEENKEVERQDALKRKLEALRQLFTDGVISRTEMNAARAEALSHFAGSGDEGNPKPDFTRPLRRGSGSGSRR